MSKSSIKISVTILGLVLPACNWISPIDLTPAPSFTPDPTTAFTLQPSVTNSVEPVVQQPQFNLIGPTGWIQFTSNEFSLWLPPNWNGGDPSSDLDAMEATNPDFVQYVAAIRANPEVFQFWGYDSNSNVDFLTDMSVIKEELPSSTSVAQFIDILTQQQPAMYTIISTDTYLMGDFQAGEVILQFELEGILIGQIRFFIRSEQGIYAITLTSEISEFNQQIDTFRQIFQHFEIATGY